MEDENRLRRLAILIDADNTSPRVADGLFEEIAKFGEASVRRIYGDFSSPRLKSWIEILQKHAIDPYQQFAYTSGKNASDIALVIDAMDLLHTGRFDGFCLVSSDSDFTRLASRLREQGADVYGFGMQKTPESFRQAASIARIAKSLVETYLGRDAGRRVLQGRIARGVADRIKTVLWFSDLRNYTRISDSAPPEEIIPLLNDYADAIVSAIHEHSGDVLKLIGDGVLAIFPAEDRARACAAALDAVQEARESVEAVNERRRAQGLPTTDMYLGLHLGVVFYGNIGSKERLDFTVVGPAVNEVGRIAALCRSVDQPILMSSAFAASVAEDRGRFASVGRFALRGVGDPQELYTLDAQG